MKNFFITIGLLIIFTFVFISCTSTNFRQDDVLPFEYFQSLKKQNEKLVFLAPVLAENHTDSFLYIITNPENIQTANDTIRNTNNASVNDINKLLNNFSPIVVRSTTQAQYGDGIAIFTIPENINDFFYVYLNFTTAESFTFNTKAEVKHGIMPFPPDLEYIFIGFTENQNEMSVFAFTGLSELKSIFDNTNGLFGVYLSKNQKQIGFNEVTFDVRFQYLQGQKESYTPQVIGSLARDSKFWEFNYYEWSDGCLTTKPEHTFHQRETIYVNRQIDYFNNYIQQNNAEPYGSSTRITFAVYTSDGSYYSNGRFIDRYVRYSLQLYRKPI